tara:strand:- start:545 stop:994 length:450 start_codon:yes stop_codon:yes gene_type:complete
MNWKKFIKVMETNYPGIKPDKLLPLVERMVGKKNKLTDYEIISREWKTWIIKSYKRGLGIPKGIKKDNLSTQKRIKYITRGKNYKFSWELFHPVYYNDKVRTSDSNGKFTGETIMLKNLGNRKISDRDFGAINHERNITRLLQRAKIIK